MIQPEHGTAIQGPLQAAAKDCSITFLPPMGLFISRSHCEAFDSAQKLILPINVGFVVGEVTFPEHQRRSRSR